MSNSALSRLVVLTIQMLMQVMSAFAAQVDMTILKPAMGWKFLAAPVNTAGKSPFSSRSRLVGDDGLHFKPQVGMRNLHFKPVGASTIVDSDSLSSRLLRGPDVGDDHGGAWFDFGSQPGLGVVGAVNDTYAWRVCPDSGFPPNAGRNASYVSGPAYRVQGQSGLGSCKGNYDQTGIFSEGYVASQHQELVTTTGLDFTKGWLYTLTPEFHVQASTRRGMQGPHARISTVTGFLDSSSTLVGLRLTYSLLGNPWFSQYENSSGTPNFLGAASVTGLSNPGQPAQFQLDSGSSQTFGYDDQGNWFDGGNNPSRPSGTPGNAAQTVVMNLVAVSHEPERITDMVVHTRSGNMVSAVTFYTARQTTTFGHPLLSDVSVKFTAPSYISDLSETDASVAQWHLTGLTGITSEAGIQSLGAVFGFNMMV